MVWLSSLPSNDRVWNCEAVIFVEGRWTICSVVYYTHLVTSKQPLIQYLFHSFNEKRSRLFENCRVHTDLAMQLRYEAQISRCLLVS